MKINNITALDYAAQGDALTLVLGGTTLEEITGMDTGVLTVQTDGGDVVEAFVGYALRSVTLNVGDGTYTAALIQGARDTTAAALSAMAGELAEARVQVREMNVTGGIAFVTLAEAGSIDPATAGEHAELFAPWAVPVAYAVGQLRRYTDGKLYKCLTAHTSQESWTPDASSSLWAAVSDPAEAWPAWVQPVGSTDAYPLGAKASHGGKHWVSTADANVWEPGVFGWDEQTAG